MVSKLEESLVFKDEIHHNKMHERKIKDVNKRNGYISHGVKNQTVPKVKSNEQEICNKRRYPSTSQPADEIESGPLLPVLLTFMSYSVVMIMGYLRDFIRKLSSGDRDFERGKAGYVPLYQSFENFYKRNLFRRICDCWNIPIKSVPGAVIEIQERISNDNNQTFVRTKNSFKALNMGSYNYLGFAENEGPRTDIVEATIKEYGVGICSTRHEFGTLDIHQELEALVSKFVGVEDCIVVGMGFATNTTNIPTFLGKGSLIISDELNHASLILGCRLSGAVTKVFKHNDTTDLEEKLRQAIIKGQPRTHRPWKKIVIIVEGIYSMEGTIVDLPEIIRLKKKYKAYLYVDEAHSIGALGSHGRGVIDYYGCNPRDVDLLMGTFTKSFGAAGGYIAGSKKLINHLRRYSHSFTYGTSMAAPVAQQILLTMKAIMGIDGTNEGAERIQILARNTHYFRKKLKQLGGLVYGNDDSPVVPLIVYCPSKISATIRLLKQCGIAVVGVGFPATSLTGCRIRFCMSASHTKEMLDQAIQAIDNVKSYLFLNLGKCINPDEEIIY